jgi:hypothetical protein
LLYSFYIGVPIDITLMFRPKTNELMTSINKKPDNPPLQRHRHDIAIQTRRLAPHYRHLRHSLAKPGRFDASCNLLIDITKIATIGGSDPLHYERQVVVWGALCDPMLLKLLHRHSTSEYLLLANESLDKYTKLKPTFLFGALQINRLGHANTMIRTPQILRDPFR